MRNYDVRHWYFEILEMIRKLLMTSVIAFIYPRSSAQLAAALLLSVLSAVHVQYTRPFLDNKIGDTQTYALMAQSLTLLYGVMLLFQEIYSDMLRLPQSFAQGGITHFFAGLVVCMNLGTAAFPFFSMLVAWVVAYRSTRKQRTRRPSVRRAGRATAADPASQGSTEQRRDALLWSRSCLSDGPAEPAGLGPRHPQPDPPAPEAEEQGGHCPSNQLVDRGAVAGQTPRSEISVGSGNAGNAGNRARNTLNAVAGRVSDSDPGFGAQPATVRPDRTAPAACGDTGRLLWASASARREALSSASGVAPQVPP
jgi:hypothetical protein